MEDSGYVGHGIFRELSFLFSPPPQSTILDRECMCACGEGDEEVGTFFLCLFGGGVWTVRFRGYAIEISFFRLRRGVSLIRVL